MKLVLIVLLSLVILNSNGQGKYCETVELFMGLTEYGEFKQRKVHKICSDDKNQLVELVKQEKTRNHNIEFEEGLKFREQALTFQGFYTDPVSGYTCVNATVVDKFKSTVRRGSGISGPGTLPITGNPNVGDSTTSGAPSSDARIARSKRQRACRGVTTIPGSEKQDAMEAEEAESAAWITENEYNIPPSEYGNLFDAQGYNQIKESRRRCKLVTRVALYTQQMENIRQKAASDKACNRARAISLAAGASRRAAAAGQLQARAAALRAVQRRRAIQRGDPRGPQRRG